MSPLFQLELGCQGHAWAANISKTHVRCKVLVSSTHPALSTHQASKFYELCGTSKLHEHNAGSSCRLIFVASRSDGCCCHWPDEHDVQAELAHIQTLVTLSPLPAFRSWLEGQLQRCIDFQASASKSQQLHKRCNFLPSACQPLNDMQMDMQLARSNPHASLEDGPLRPPRTQHITFGVCNLGSVS